MRARTRFLLDTTLLAAFLAAYRPQWTGIAFHQWLSIGLIVPVLVHLFVNWEWALRILRTFIDKLLHTSRLNWVVDCALFVSAVSVTLSGFMVSPMLLAPLHSRPNNLPVWVLVHHWSANATILILAVHAALHWRWFAATAKRLAENPAPARARAATLLRAQQRSSGAPVSERSGALAGAAAGEPARRSRVGLRKTQAAKERAAAIRAISVVGATGALGLAVFAGVGAATPVLAHEAKTASASGGSQLCPVTGCSATSCHGATHADPYAFYDLKRPSAKAPAKKHRRVSASRVVRVASTNVATSRRHTVGSPATPTARHAAVHAATPAAAPKPKPAPKPRPHLFTCPQTGCTASSCHGAHHQSAASYYR